MVLPMSPSLSYASLILYFIKMKDIFEFNHIDRTLSESDIKTLKDFYSHYHKKYWCFKR